MGACELPYALSKKFMSQVNCLKHSVKKLQYVLVPWRQHAYHTMACICIHSLSCSDLCPTICPRKTTLATARTLWVQLRLVAKAAKHRRTYGSFAISAALGFLTHKTPAFCSKVREFGCNCVGIVPQPALAPFMLRKQKYIYICFDQANNLLSCLITRMCFLCFTEGLLTNQAFIFAFH